MVRVRGGKKLLAISMANGGYHMAVFTCEKCGEKVDTRCKPKKCPACSEAGSMCKEEVPKAPKTKKN
jgi:rubrerythrin